MLRRLRSCASRHESLASHGSALEHVAVVVALAGACALTIFAQRSTCLWARLRLVSIAQGGEAVVDDTALELTAWRALAAFWTGGARFAAVACGAGLLSAPLVWPRLRRGATQTQRRRPCAASWAEGCTGLRTEARPP